MKKLSYFIALIILIMIYILVSQSLNNEMILPKINLIYQSLKTISLRDWVINLGSTIIKTGLSYFIGLIIALVLVLIAYFYRLSQFIYPYISVLKSLPTISIILVMLIWFGSEQSIYIIPLIVIIPIIYEALLHQLQNVDSKLIEVCQIYHIRSFKKLRYLYLYPILEGLMLSLKQTFGLCFKIIVMAEVIGQAPLGIGAKIQAAKTNLDMASVFSWTIVLIVLVLILDGILNLVKMKVIKWK